MRFCNVTKFSNCDLFVKAESELLVLMADDVVVDEEYWSNDALSRCCFPFA